MNGHVMFTESHQPDQSLGIHLRRFDKARALEIYARQAKNTEAERLACEDQAARRAPPGQLLQQMEKARGAAGNPGGREAPIVRSDDTTVICETTLAELGILQNAAFAVAKAGRRSARAVRNCPARRAAEHDRLQRGQPARDIPGFLAGRVAAEALPHMCKHGAVRPYRKPTRNAYLQLQVFRAFADRVFCIRKTFAFCMGATAPAAMIPACSQSINLEGVRHQGKKLGRPKGRTEGRGSHQDASKGWERHSQSGCYLELRQRNRAAGQAG
jgi:hypothetical protein